MRKLLLALAVAALFAGCGDNDDDSASKAATPAPTEEAEASGEVHELDLDGYSEGVKKYYGGAHVHEGGDELADVEAEFHQPPLPPEAGVGDAITLTGSNIGVRVVVTLKRVKAAGGRTRANLLMENTGITIYDGAFENLDLTFADGTVESPAKSCTRDVDLSLLRIDVNHSQDLCVEFEGDGKAERLQIALEQVPVEAGGIWLLD